MTTTKTILTQLRMLAVFRSIRWSTSEGSLDMVVGTFVDQGIEPDMVARSRHGPIRNHHRNCDGVPAEDRSAAQRRTGQPAPVVAGTPQIPERLLAEDRDQRHREVHRDFVQVGDHGPGFRGVEPVQSLEGFETEGPDALGGTEGLITKKTVERHGKSGDLEDRPAAVNSSPAPACHGIGSL